MNEENKGTPAEEKKPLSEQKRAALLRYMAVLFAVAFLLVLASLILQMHSSRTAISEMSKSSSDALSNAMANAEFLQDQNRELQEENRKLREQLDAADDQSAGAEQLTQELTALKAEYDALKAQSAGAETAYEALITALTCRTHEGNVTFTRAMETVAANQQYLSQDALEVYQSLLDEG